MRRAGDRVVVVGGSVGGVLAARVLADRFDRVTVLDRDLLPGVGRRRRGVPQDRHVHALQTRGKRVIDRLFPGFSDELVDAGALSGEVGRDGTMCLAGCRLLEVGTDLDLLTVSRPLLEGHLRARLAGLANVEVLDGRGVHGLLLNEAGEVAGVRVLRREEASAEEILRADLTVDATGRGSRLPHWLEAVGFPSPGSDETGLAVAYTSARFPRRRDDAKHIIIASPVPPDGRRGGAAIAVEGDSWVVTLGGIRGEQPPRELDGFVEYAATLPVRDVHRIVGGRQPLGEFVAMRYPTGRRRRYGRLDRFPGRLVVLGDAWCSFNPIYGQGMSVAAAQAMVLGRCVDDGLGSVGHRFFDAAAAVVDDAWQMAAGEDARYMPARSAGRTWRQRLVARYRSRVLRAATRDRVVARRLLQVMAMQARPVSLMDPRVVARVLAAAVANPMR